MAVLSMVYPPHPALKTKCEPVSVVDEGIKKLVQDMLETMEYEKAVGLGANMFGILKPVAVVDLYENGVSKPYVFINPEITYKSPETHAFEEASLSFPGVSADITRARSIKVKYLDLDGKSQELEAEGFFASVIQHEVDYLNGVVFLDHLSKMKRDIMLKKVQKFLKMYPPHVHSEHCSH